MKNKIYFGKNATVTQTEEGIEISVTYEVIENIGMQERVQSMEERSLRVVGTDKTFFNKLTNTLNKFLQNSFKI